MILVHAQSRIVGSYIKSFKSAAMFEIPFVIHNFQFLVVSSNTLCCVMPLANSQVDTWRILDRFRPLPLPVSLPLLPVVPGGGPLPLAKSLQEGVDEPLKILFPTELVEMPDDSNAKLRITKDDHMAGEYVVCSTTKHLASGHDQVEKI